MDVKISEEKYKIYRDSVNYFLNDELGDKKSHMDGILLFQQNLIEEKCVDKDKIEEINNKLNYFLNSIDYLFDNFVSDIVDKNNKIEVGITEINVLCKRCMHNKKKIIDFKFKIGMVYLELDEYSYYLVENFKLEPIGTASRYPTLRYKENTEISDFFKYIINYITMLFTRKPARIAPTP